MSEPGTVVVSWWPLTYVVVAAVPFHVTTEVLLKLLPFTVKTKPAPPAAALLGEIELTDGVDGQEHEMAGSRKNANAHKSANFLIVAKVVVRPDITFRGWASWRADYSLTVKVA
jgi:hypothetical protein